MPASQLSIPRHFASLKDPRRSNRRLHRLLDIIVIGSCAVICGANTWPEVATFGQRRRRWLKRFVRLPNGIPCHDTFERVFDALDPIAFQRCLLDWTRAISAAFTGTTWPSMASVPASQPAPRVAWGPSTSSAPQRPGTR